MCKISVIVPIYKSECYIERCARSLLSQTLDDIEYIFIDDCSPDKSVEILERVIDDYPNRKAQVIIHKMDSNSGQAQVRKWGISNAHGEYIMHCDSDDWMDVSSLKESYEFAQINKCDIVFFDVIIANNNSSKLIVRKIDNWSKESVLSTLISGKLMGALWGAIIKRSLFSGNIEYPRYNLQEDLFLLIQSVINSQKCSYLDKPLYYYFENQKSITKEDGREYYRFMQSKGNVDHLIRVLERYNLANDYKSEILARKLITKNYLLPFQNIYNTKQLWETTYPEVNYRILFNDKVSIVQKCCFLAAKFNCFTIFRKIEGVIRGL